LYAVFSRCKSGKSVGGGGHFRSCMKIQFTHSYEDIISLGNLLEAWAEFVRDKRSRRDVQEFERNLTTNLIALHEDLATHRYRHSHYTAFNISDPKPRRIHKAGVRDRVLHHAIYRKLYPFFERTFIADSFSCRLEKGSYKGQNRFCRFARKVSLNHTKTAWVLKCDIRKFFASIDQGTLLNILAGYIPDLGILLLLQEIIDSFSVGPDHGLPLGNLTSQLFCNVYMNELDQFIKHKLHARYYVRYADDFVLFSEDKEWLTKQVPLIADFLGTKLRLSLHPDKLYIKSFASGVDFLGWVHFPTHRVTRTTTKRRMVRRIKEHPTNETLQSYLGLLSHGDEYKLKQDIMDLYCSLRGYSFRSIFRA
jgi:RNA-directed DNA polymerase